jgi:RNA polymerase sigma factor (sigma-70 family)
MSTRSRSDAILIRECLGGDENAWSGLVDRYKNLIYSIPIKAGIPQDDAADIFQGVCLELFSNLEKIREPNALPKWLIQVAYRKSLQWKTNDARYSSYEGDDPPEPQGLAEVPHQLLISAQNEQMLRDAMDMQSDRCRKMILMLFFETPSRPYDEVAKELGLAVGSIGFIRGRCLKSLRKALEQKGFK